MTNLKNLLPLHQIYYHSIDIYAWNDKVADPYPGIIEGGAYISVQNDDLDQKLFVMEINNNEFLQDHIHRVNILNQLTVTSIIKINYQAMMMIIFS